MAPAQINFIFHLKTLPAGEFSFQVNGSNNTAELQAPLEAIAFMLLHPPLPSHIIFHLDSQYVTDVLRGLSLPSSNIELAILLLGCYHHLASRTYVELRKVKSHTGIPGNDLTASKGITSCTAIGRFATFPPLVLPALPRLEPPSPLLGCPISLRRPSHLLPNCLTHLPLILNLSVIKSKSPPNLTKKMDFLQPPCWLLYCPPLRTLAYHQKGTIQISTPYSIS